MRTWLRLPKDTTLTFMHSKIDGNGLGISCLETTIPLEQRAKCERLVNSGTLEVANIVQCKAVVSDTAVVNVPIFVYGKPVGFKLEKEKVWLEAVVKTHDGADLMNIQVGRASFYWLRNPKYVFPLLFIRGLQLRDELLTTKVRSGRGYRRAPEDLRGCPELIGHISEKCSVTYDARCARHNRVVQMIGRLLRARGHSVFVEPIIPSSSTFCKPDLVVGCGSSILVMDVTIVSSRRFVKSWQLKVGKYDNPATNGMITTVCAYNHLERNAVKHTPTVLSDRGELYQKSSMELRRIGLTDRDISDICLLTIADSLKCYDTYMRMT
ncbi:Retrovirus Pol polyprotein from type-1 retrotransposable element R2 [Paragonimus heterotremus]|uniref:Retrovirus Pol polyprotein from type-1 retrotransposable element R2 n=1 Tax=Paragonimus heterotremus TaxID=100268 RepID=A0A8J4WI34_9TREM|nr:Retrovirus Pol polyprotein from type-1 retrotransposable element R2 [Paragonimus heterotremus]